MSAVTVFGAPEGWDAVLLARRAKEHTGPLLHVARDDARMQRMADAIAFFAPNAEVLRSRRSMVESGRWNSRSTTRDPPATWAMRSASAAPTPRRLVRGAKSGPSGSVGTG